MRLPIRVRVTVAFAVVLAFVLAAAGLFVYQRFRTDADRTIDAELRNRTTAFFAAHDPSPQLRVDLLGLSDEHFGQALTDGRVVASSAQLGHRPITAPVPGRRDATVATRTEHRRVRLLVTERNGTTLVLASALDDRDDALGHLARLLWAGAGLTFVVAVGLAWLLVGAALRPVERLRSAAGAYSAGDLAQRLTVPKSDDEVRRLAVTLNEMLDRIQDSFDQQRAFVDRASHELRTPIANLSLELELALRHERDEAELRAALESAATEAQRLEALAANLLVLARATDGELPVALVETDVAALVRDATSGFAARARAEDVELQIETVDEALADVDPQRLRQALTNLLDNALRVTPVGGRVAVRLECDDGTMALSVHDTGPGFAPEVRDTAFDLFVRGRSRGAAGGAGLGLAVVRAAAAAHGGTAVIDGGGPGATVTVTFPARPPGVSRDSNTRFPTLGPSRPPGAAGPQRQP